MSQATLYGIKACDTIKKARTWLEAKGVGYAFHDYKALGVSPAKLEAWSSEIGWETLLNKAGTTFRGLAEADKQDIDQTKAIALMTQHTSLIKRPVLEHGGRILVGFKLAAYEAEFS